jgi:hypothetical protein
LETTVKKIIAACIKNGQILDLWHKLAIAALNLRICLSQQALSVVRHQSVDVEQVVRARDAYANALKIFDAAFQTNPEYALLEQLRVDDICNYYA